MATSDVTPKKAGFLGAIKNLVTLALSGGLAAAIDHFAGGFGPIVLVLIAGAWHSLFTYVESWMEAKGMSPTFFDAAINFIKKVLSNWASKP